MPRRRKPAATSPSPSPSPPTPTADWTRGAFRWLAKFRTGIDTRRVTVWYSTGELVALATGRVLATLEGVETIKPLAYTESDSAAELTASARKILVFKDPSTGEYMDQYRYRPTYKPRPVSHIALPEQLLALQLNKGVMQMVSKHTWRSDSKNDPPIRRISSVRLFDVPRKDHGAVHLSYDFHTTLEKGIYSFEKFDYTAAKHDAIRWTRVGQCPSWYGPRQCMFSFKSKKLGSMADLPRAFHHFLESKFPVFLTPPGADLDHLLTPALTDKERLPAPRLADSDKPQKRQIFSLK